MDSQNSLVSLVNELWVQGETLSQKIRGRLIVEDSSSQNLTSTHNPPPSSFHTHIHTNIHKHTHAHTLEYTHTHSHINMLTHKYSHTYTHNNMERYAQILFCVCFSEGEEKVQTAKQGSTTLGNRGQRISSYPC